MTWTPGARRAAREIEAPYEGVPEHLEGPLWSWFVSAINSVGGRFATDTITLMLRERTSGSSELTLRSWRSRISEDPTLLLTLIEAWMEAYPSRPQVEQLDERLALGNSIFRVNDDGDGLEFRVTPGVKESVASTVADAPGSAGDHLIVAWNSAYGLTADPSKAYGEAIKAVEAALAPRISPLNLKATLGTMIADVKNKPEKWSFVIAGNSSVDPVVVILGMMQTLWVGQTSRHGGVQATRLETLEEARAAVMLAVSLVQLGTSGALDLASTP